MWLFLSFVKFHVEIVGHRFDHRSGGKTTATTRAAAATVQQQHERKSSTHFYSVTTSAGKNEAGEDTVLTMSSIRCGESHISTTTAATTATTTNTTTSKTDLTTFVSTDTTRIRRTQQLTVRSCCCCPRPCPPTTISGRQQQQQRRYDMALATMCTSCGGTLSRTTHTELPKTTIARRTRLMRTRTKKLEQELFLTKSKRSFSVLLSPISLLLMIVVTLVVFSSKNDKSLMSNVTTIIPTSSSSPSSSTTMTTATTTTSTFPSSLFVHSYALVSPPSLQRAGRISRRSNCSSRTVPSFYDHHHFRPSMPSLSISSSALSSQFPLSSLASSSSSSNSLDSTTRASTRRNRGRQHISSSSRLRSRFRRLSTAITATTRSRISRSMDHISDSPSSSPSSSSLSSSPAKQLFRKFQRLPLQQRSYRNFWIVPAILVVLLPAWVGRLSLQSINYLFQTIAWKSIARVSLCVWIAVSIFDNVFVTKRRQRNDMTSEWTRYALKPGARGRAIMWLLLQQAFYILWASFYKPRSRRFVTSRTDDNANRSLFGRIRSGAGSRRRRQQRVTTAIHSTNTTSTGTSIEVDYSSGTAAPTPRQLKYEAIRKKAGRNFSNGLLKLGPLYIKLGQIVSCRPGLLGKEWIDAMADLQDRVPARTGQDALDLAYSSLAGGKEEFDRLFVDFDSTPLAAASLGQVHRAKLRSNGDDIVIKVQRPFLRQIYNQDFVLLTTIAQWMDKLPSTSRNVGGIESSWTKIFVDAEEILYREIDYRDEADNAIRFANDFGLGLGGNATTPTAKAMNNRTLPSAAEWIRTPYVYGDLSNERLLVMEFVPSIKVTNRAKLDAANVTEEDRIDLTDSLARAYLRQFCANLFFSTDPHPGNLGVEVVPETGKPRLVMYDFGQAASLTRGQGDGIEEIIEAIVDTDVDRSIEAFQKMDVLVDGADLELVRAKVAENYRTGKVKANQKKLRRKGYVFRDDRKNEDRSSLSPSASSGTMNNMDMSTGKPKPTTTDANDAQVMSYFSLPAEYAFVARAISQMDGVGKSLDPEFDFISSAAPYLVEIKGADKYLADEVLKFVKNLSKFQMKTIPEWWERESRNAEWGVRRG